MHCQVKGSGRFLALCSLRPTAVLFDGEPIDYTHGQTPEGVLFVEVVLPQGYNGVPRRLVVQWDEASTAGGIANGGRVR